MGSRRFTAKARLKPGLRILNGAAGHRYPRVGFLAGRRRMRSMVIRRASSSTA